MLPVPRPRLNLTNGRGVQKTAPPLLGRDRSDDSRIARAFACLAQLAVDRERENLELRVRRRQLFARDLALRPEQMRHVRVAVERDAIGRGSDHLVERGAESLDALSR